MKKTVLSIISCIALGSLVNAQNVNIPDMMFKVMLLANNNINTNGDNEIQVSEASAVTGLLNVSNGNITDLTGIEAFTSVTNLFCNDNQLTSLDVSQNTALTQLECKNNSLVGLDISQNSQLTELDCSNNQLTMLNLANGNNASILTVTATGNSSLTCIQHDTGISPANYAGWLKDATASWSDDCNYPCTGFIDIQDGNFLDALLAHGTTTAGAGVSVIDTDGDGQICITEAEAYTGTLRLNNWNISNLSGIESFTSVTELNCGGNSLTSLNVSQNSALTNLTCFGNQLTSLDVSQNSALTILNCNSNQLTSLDVSQNTALVRVVCFGNQLTSLNLANGNNATINYMAATSNPNLSCIQHDNGFTPPAWNSSTQLGWQKDAAASWSDDCSGGGTSSINEKTISFTIVPNPTSGTVKIDTEVAINSIEVFSMTGQKIHSSTEKIIDLSAVKSGVYFVKVSSEKGTTTKKIIKR